VNNPSEPQGTSYIKSIKDWLSTCPAFTKTIYYIVVILMIPNLLFGGAYFFGNSPHKVVDRFQIYRLVTSPFCFWGIIEQIFCLFAYLPVSAKLEKEWGTTRTAVDFFLKNLVINICWIILSFSFNFWTVTCYGLLPSLFALLMRDLANPEEVKSFMCFPVQIKTKYYPAALWILVSILTGRLRFDCLVGMLVGYVYLKWLNKSYYSFLNTRRMVAWTETCFFSRIKKSPNFIETTNLSIEDDQPERPLKASDIITNVSSYEYQAPLFQTQVEQIPEVDKQDEDAKINITPDEQDVPEIKSESNDQDANQYVEINETSEEQDVNKDVEINQTPDEQEETNKIEENTEDPVLKA